MKHTILVICFLFIGEIVFSQDYCEFIRTVEAYQNKVELNDGENSIDSTTFNIDDYLELFKLLKRDKEYEYCYTYYNSGLEGQPILFVKNDEFIPDIYIDGKMIIAKEEIEEMAIKSSLMYDLPEAIKQKRILQDRISNQYRQSYSIEYRTSPKFTMKNHLSPSMSEMGYFQYLYFNQMGESFAGFWHSREKTVICSNEDFNSISNYYENISTEIDNLSPKILLQEKKCIIIWYENIELEGIYKRTYEIQIEEPYNINRTESILIANEIDNGIIH